MAKRIFLHGKRLFLAPVHLANLLNTLKMAHLEMENFVENRWKTIFPKLLQPTPSRICIHIEQLSAFMWRDKKEG